MGVSIHYTGRIDRIEALPQLVDELEDIAHSMHWQSIRVEHDETNQTFRGIILNPSGECEPLTFIFDPDGRLRSLADLITHRVEPDPRCSFYCATKTQFTDVDTHIWIIGLLRYLKKTALSDLNVTDEGEYWETGNAATLTEKREFLKGMIDQLAEGLSNAQLSDLKSHPSSPSELNIDSLVAQIEKIAHDAHAKRNKEK